MVLAVLAIVSAHLFLNLVAVVALVWQRRHEHDAMTAELEHVRQQAALLTERLRELQRSLGGPVWEIVCPDGRVRHPPYVDRGRAEWDAQVAEDDCRYLGYTAEHVAWLRDPNCRSGRHRVQPTELT